MNKKFYKELQQHLLLIVFKVYHIFQTWPYKQRQYIDSFLDDSGHRPHHDILYMYTPHTYFPDFIHTSHIFWRFRQKMYTSKINIICYIKIHNFTTAFIITDFSITVNIKIIYFYNGIRYLQKEQNFTLKY